MSRKPDPHHRSAPDQDALERELEEGLKQTFPASDPPTATQPVARDDTPPKR